MGACSLRVKRRKVKVMFLKLTKTLLLHVGVGYMLISEKLPRIRNVPKSADLDRECSLISVPRLNTEEALNIRQHMNPFNVYYCTNNCTYNYHKIIFKFYNFILIIYYIYNISFFLLIFCAFVGVIISIN